MHPIIQAEVDEFRKFAEINDFYQRGFPMGKMESFLSAALHRAIEKAGKEMVGADIEMLENLKMTSKYSYAHEDRAAANWERIIVKTHNLALNEVIKKKREELLALSKLDTIINFKE